MKTKAVSVAPALAITVIWVSMAVFATYIAEGQESKRAAEGQEETQESVNKRYLADMQTLADTVQVTAGKGEQRMEVKLVPKPLYRFSDLKRFITDGTVWAWGI